MRSIGRYIFIGLLTVAPLAITWFILRFLFSILSSFGEPWIRGVARGLRPRYPAVAELLLNDTLQSIAAVLVVLAFLYLLGWGAGRVLGQRLIRLFEAGIGAIPFVDNIYRATKRLLAVTGGTTPEGERRVVLIDFPSPEMKAVGIITHTMRDSETGEQLAAVYVPTAPNPTNGFVEIVPIRSIVFTDWSFDQAMSFVVTGGSSSPDEVRFTRPSKPPPPDEKAAAARSAR